MKPYFTFHFVKIGSASRSYSKNWSIKQLLNMVDQAGSIVSEREGIEYNRSTMKNKDGNGTSVECVEVKANTKEDLIWARKIFETHPRTIGKNHMNNAFAFWKFYNIKLVSFDF